MFSISVNCFTRRSCQFINTYLKREFSQPVLKRQIVVHEKPKQRRIVSIKRSQFSYWFFLSVPVFTFGLGTWQVYRKKWKLNLIEELNKRTTTPPISIPDNLDELQNLEYCPVKVRGTFHHDKELYLGPKTLKEENKSSLMSASGKNGYHVVTPFTLADRDLTILVNRGWVPSKNKLPETRQEAQVKDEVELTGLVRLTEKRAPFQKTSFSSQTWTHRDLEKMAEVTGAAPVFIDAVTSSSVKGGPIGGQTNITLRDEHLSYIFTWYTLSLCTGLMWYFQYARKVPM